MVTFAFGMVAPVVSVTVPVRVPVTTCPETLPPERRTRNTINKGTANSPIGGSAKAGPKGLWSWQFSWCDSWALCREVVSRRQDLSPSAIPDRPTESQATVKKRQKRCLIKLCHVVLLKVAIFEFCLAFRRVGAQISREWELARQFPSFL